MSCRTLRDKHPHETNQLSVQLAKKTRQMARIITVKHLRSSIIMQTLTDKESDKTL